MAHGKKSRTPGQSTLQKQRTYKNQAKYYRALIAGRPSHPHKSVWEKNAEFYESHA